MQSEIATINTAKPMSTSSNQCTNQSKYPHPKIMTPLPKGFITSMNGVMAHIASMTVNIENASSTLPSVMSPMPLDQLTTNSSTTC